MPIKSLHFDAQDYNFLSIIQRSIDLERDERELFFANLHPNGIVELAIASEFRVASSVLHLLDSLETGHAEERISALRALREAVLVSAKTTFRHNTARVLIQIMKELIRAQGDDETQLKLAHDFRQAATGKPSVVRTLLKRYYLLEMPEAWNQAVFDHHVHDANTKGRKNATHLIMDAWIKGIRNLTVIYYNYVPEEAAQELLRAADIMGVNLRIGFLFHAAYRGRMIDFIWVPRGFTNADDFLSFLAEPPMRHLMEEGRKSSQWMETIVLRMLDHWNQEERPKLEPLLGTEPPALTGEDFLEFVSTGQASVLHLAEFLHRRLLPFMTLRFNEIQDLLEQPGLSKEQAELLRSQSVSLNTLTPEVFLEWLNSPEHNPYVNTFHDAPQDPECPDILRLTPLVLLDWLTSLHSGNRIILNLAELTAEDVLNLLWDCQGLISHLELFNLKDWQEGKASHIKAINDLQRAINDGSAPRLKQLIWTMIHNCMEESQPDNKAEPSEEDQAALEQLERDMDDSSLMARELMRHSTSSPTQQALLVGSTLAHAVPNCASRGEKLRLILRNIPVLLNFYRKTKLYSRMGTDSTSRAGMRFGMGLVYPETLPARARKELRNTTNTSRLRLPLRTELLERVTCRIGVQEEHPGFFTSLVRRIPGLEQFGKPKEKDWLAVPEHTIVCNEGMCSTDTASYTPEKGNIVTLGGMGHSQTNLFFESGKQEQCAKPDMIYINTRLANILKVLAGFIPAFLTFQYTQQEHWVLAWFGAFIWFFVTGMRNIVQAVLGGGGFRRSPLLRWNNYVSWSRLCDSLMYTGFSVVLLELVVRRIILVDILKINALDAPFFTFTLISLTNGIYLASHNYFRGLQREAIIGNLFRSVFAIPVALTYNYILYALFSVIGVPNPTDILLAAAAIISKVASDTVAGIIEGLADRNSNVRLRLWDYNTTIQNVFDLYAQLEMLFPEQGVLEMMAQPKALLKALEEEDKALRLAFIVNALDLMYFWFYQPRAAYALNKKIQQISMAERLVFLRSQQVLKREREVSQLFVDGLVGKQFSRALSFYLEQHAEYLREMEELCLAPRKRLAR